MITDPPMITMGSAEADEGARQKSRIPGYSNREHHIGASFSQLGEAAREKSTRAAKKGAKARLGPAHGPAAAYRRTNLPTRSTRAVTIAAAPDPTLIRAPIFNSTSSWPGPTVAVAKKSAIVKPVALINPSGTRSRQCSPRGRCRPNAAAERNAEEEAQRLGDQRREWKAPDPRFERPERHARVHQSERQQGQLSRMPRPQFQPVQWVGGARRRVNEKAGIACGVRQEGDDGGSRQGRMESTEKERAP